MDILWIIYGYGWWLTLNPSEKYKLVNWDDDNSKYFLEKKNNVPNHQPVFIGGFMGTDLSIQQN